MQQRRTDLASAMLWLMLGAMVYPMAAWCDVVVRIDQVRDRAVDSRSFRLERPMTLHVECEGAGEGDEETDLFAYGWILDAHSRNVVWLLDPEETEDGHGDNLVFKGDVQLPAGEYIAYYASFFQERRKVIRLFGKKLAEYRVSGSRKPPRESRYWGLTLAVKNGNAARDFVSLRRRPPVGNPKNFVRIVRAGDNAHERAGFTLPEEMQIDVHCQGEYDAEAGVVDVGWILDAKTRQFVWQLDRGNFKHGGGAFKNKVAHETIRLPAGNYIASYVTDGSHSYEAWNAAPPYDDEAWGLILSAKSESAARRISAFEEERDPSREIVALLKQRDGAYESRGFTLKKPLDLRIYALGEYDRGNHHFVDYGWVQQFGSDRTVWTMKRENTRHAGGADKNRVADDVVHLPAGDYVVYYATDDSHAYRDWNETPPRDPVHWGILIEGIGADFDVGHVESFDVEARLVDAKPALVRLVRVRDSETRSARFKLDRRQQVHILALGEGAYREMHDYGWIEDVGSGEVVWEMSMRNTRHAGGARKNRRFDNDIFLDAGQYEVHYVSDPSHAFGSWNQPRPHDPQNWGITITASQNR